jgi:Mitochondrial large subunit ribosomal protein (Img2)
MTMENSLNFIAPTSKFRKDGTKVTTLIRKVTGDRDLFIGELRSVLQLHPPTSGKASDDNIRVRTGGLIEINGNRVRELKQWLAGLGF